MKAIVHATQPQATVMPPGHRQVSTPPSMLGTAIWSQVGAEPPPVQGLARTGGP